MVQLKYWRTGDPDDKRGNKKFMIWCCKNGVGDLNRIYHALRPYFLTGKLVNFFLVF
jgi:hypothetical protein